MSVDVKNSDPNYWDELLVKEGLGKIAESTCEIENNVGEILRGDYHINDIKDDINVFYDYTSGIYQLFLYESLISIIRFSQLENDSEINIDFSGNVNASGNIFDDIIIEFNEYFDFSLEEIHIGGLLEYTYRLFIEAMKSQGIKKITGTTKSGGIHYVHSVLEDEGLIKYKELKNGIHYILEI